jgi:thiamine transport system substrate-binding protein
MSSLAVLAVLLAGCAASGETQEGPAGEPTVLTVMTHDSFAVSEAVVDRFEQENGVQVSFVPSGDTGAALNRAILSKDSPLADVFYGVDNTFLSRAVEEGILESYESPLLEQVPAEFKLDPTFAATPVDYGDVCINYDKAYFADKGLPVPVSLEELTDPRYNGLLVVENPATSSPGLAFLLATIAHFGEEGYLDFWQRLADNGVVTVNDWNTAYYTNFSAAGEGQQPMVVSYASSPVAEVVFAETPPSEAPTGSIIGPQTCFRQIEFAGILKGTPNRALAEKFIDFLLSEPFQEDIPLQMFVFPVNQQAELPEPFRQHAQIPPEPASLSPQAIAAGREGWIQAWSEIVLK